jgi:DNA polymerase V
LIRAALFGLKRIFRSGFAYKKAEVILTGITSAVLIQQSLFSNHETDEKSARLMAVID